MASPFLLASYSCHAELILFDSDRWEFFDRPGPVKHEVQTYLGEESLYIRLGYGLVKDLEITNGIIEYDVAFPEPKGEDKGFFGILLEYCGIIKISTILNIFIYEFTSRVILNPPSTRR